MEQRKGSGTLERRKGKAAAEAEAETEQRRFPQSLELALNGVVAEKEAITKQRQTEAMTEAERSNDGPFPVTSQPIMTRWRGPSKRRRRPQKEFCVWCRNFTTIFLSLRFGLVAGGSEDFQNVLRTDSC
jgi:hypothetical protein